MGHFRLGCDSRPSRFLQTRSCTLCPSKGTGGEDASLQKLLDLQRWPRHRLGDCSHTRTLTIRGSESAQTILLVFFGFCIGWVSTTIARYVYPPPKRWELNRRQE